MKTIRKALFPGLAAVIVLLCSCEKNPEPNIHGDGSAGANYSYSNDLQKMQLKGAVKTLVIADLFSQKSYEFNRKGNITTSRSNDGYRTTASANTKEIYPEIAEIKSLSRTEKTNRNIKPRNTDGIDIHNYKYDSSDRLTGIYSAYDTLLLSYDNHGAYIPFDNILFDIPYRYSMRQNLSQVVYCDGHTRETRTFKVEGNKMYLYTNAHSYDNPEKAENDTIYYRLNAAKMPIHKESGAGFMTWSYYPDNMLKEIETNFFDGIYITKFSFSDDKDYLLLTKYQSITFHPDGSTGIDGQDYTYNEHKDLVSELSIADNRGYKYEYAYDAQGNWERKYIYKDNKTPWQSELYKRRTITYY